MSYATPRQLLDRYDWNDIGDLVSDSGTQVTEALILTNAKVAAALNDASGEVDAALLMGNRYSPSDLANLNGHSAYHLIRITCDIAMARIMGRRPGRDTERIKAMSEMAESHLERLRNGENVFNIQANKDAAGPSVSTITAAEYDNLNLLRDQTRHYYPRRRLPNP